MKIFQLAVITTSIALTACGNSNPSLSDARKQIEAEFYGAIGNCSQIKLDDFEKINGMPNGERHYTLQIKYSMKVIPPSKNAKIADEYIDSRKNGTAQQAEGAVISQLIQNFDPACAAPLNRILQRNDIMHNEKEFPHGILDYYSRGFIKVSQENIPMVLTENGWIVIKK